MEERFFPLLVFSACLALLAADVTAQGDASAATGGLDVGLEHAMSLYRAWESAYGLAPGNPLPPSTLSLPPNVPPAPHLEACAARTAFRLQTEQRGANGEAPAWVNGTEACGGVPQPPWIRGSDSDNLPHTRVAQSDIWQHQFPAACSQQRLLLVQWPPLELYGLGAQLHIVTAMMSAAMDSGRVMVPMPGNFSHANHSECEALGHGSSFSCYFFRTCSLECEQAAMAWYRSSGLSDCGLLNDVVAEIRSDAPVVCIYALGNSLPKFIADAARRWNHSYSDRPMLMELDAKMFHPEDRQLMTHWWRSQSIRFLLRCPSAYLCHTVNRMRHTVYGLHVATRTASAAAAQKAILAVLVDPRAQDGNLLKFNTGEEAKILSALDYSAAPNLESEAWPGRGYGSCLPTSAPESRDKVDGSVVGVGSEPYIMRPIVSIHVRQGDKGGEMMLFSFRSFMWLAYRLRRHEPDLHYSWLSTEMQSVIDEAETFRDWSFLYSKNPRQAGTTHMFTYQKEAGLAEVVGISLGNLIVASQCDYFVGVLGSNWNRLINELKSTNGRYLAGYVTVNQGEW